MAIQLKKWGEKFVGLINWIGLTTSLWLPPVVLAVVAFDVWLLFQLRGDVGARGEMALVAASLGLMLVTLAYTIHTSRLVETNQRLVAIARDDLRNSLHPFLLLRRAPEAFRYYYEPNQIVNLGLGEVPSCVHNVGTGLALNPTAWIEIEDETEKIVIDNIKQRLNSLGSGQWAVFLWTIFPKALDYLTAPSGADDRKKYQNAYLRVKYDDVFGRCHETRVILDLQAEGASPQWQVVEQKHICDLTKTDKTIP